MSVGDVDAEEGSRIVRTPSLELEWIRDREPGSSRVTVFDPRPARLDTAWIEIDERSIVSLRAMR